MRSRRKFGVCFIVLLAGGALAGCGKSAKHEPPQDVIATVNQEPILASELKHELAIRTRQDPQGHVSPEMEKEQLELMIDRKLIIQEAVRQGLARDERFVNTIKNFWEQTLVREFFDHKKKEFAANASVLETEIQAYYSRLGRRVTFMVLKSNDKTAASNIFSQWKQEGRIDPAAWAIVGPVMYSELDSDVLRKSFDAVINEVQLIEAAPDYYLVMVKDRQEIPPQPLDILRPAIARDIQAMKEQKLLDDWLDSQRAQASISILKP